MYLRRHGTMVTRLYRAFGRKTMPRIAHCCCGALRVETTGEPTAVVACHCHECQRRTGPAFGVGVFFEMAQVRAEGASKVYTRDGQEGRKLHAHFCPGHHGLLGLGFATRPYRRRFRYIRRCFFPCANAIGLGRNSVSVGRVRAPSAKSHLARSPRWLISGESKKGHLPDRILLSA
jgi:Glutathione-dependent formaldehyde-activating enzyme